MSSAPATPDHPEELSLQQSANLLNVSRQYLQRLLDEDHLPYLEESGQRRLRTEDVLAFKRERGTLREEKLDELVRPSEEYGGYDDKRIQSDISLEGIRDRVTEAHDALRAAQHEHHALPGGDSSVDTLSSALVVLERCLRNVAHDSEIRHHQRGHTLDRLAGKITADATASILEARLRMLSMEADDWHRHDPVRLTLIAANNALELAEYVHTLKGSEA